MCIYLRVVQWDVEKAAANRQKHDVDFADAVTAPEDPLALTVRDAHPEDERFATVGTDALGRVLLVVYTWVGDEVRLISAERPRAQSAGIAKGFDEEKL